MQKKLINEKESEKDSEREKMKAFAASCKPLEELLDSVRDIDGFPIGKDEDILALSDAPWYTACPNPYIKDFIEAFGKPYDEDTDTYERTPFVSDVSEGKNDPIYNAHSYHTKVPHKAIMPFIEHYTEEGDIVFDGFCGTGMTGVAAQLLNRKVLLSDLSPTASQIAYNYNKKPLNESGFEKEAKRILKEIEDECSWMFETLHSDGITKGKINFTVWSDVFICPYCKNEYVFWDAAVDKEKETVLSEYACPSCKSILKKSECERATIKYFDTAIDSYVTQTKQVPVWIFYMIGKTKHGKVPDKFDLDLIKKIEENVIPYWFPTTPILRGDKTGEPIRIGITHVHHFYTKRNLWVLAAIFNKIIGNPHRLFIIGIIRSSLSYSTKLIKVNVNRLLNNGGVFSLGAVTGTFYVPSLSAERPILPAIKNKVKSSISVFKSLKGSKNLLLISTGSSISIDCESNSVDYIFTDPPFGKNLMYSELNFLWESWLKIFTNNSSEAIINNSQGKGLNEYKELMTLSFKEMYRILKPNRWITVEFHNSEPSVWNAIQDSLTKAGFIVAQVTVLDKKQGSFNQVGTSRAVKNDLIINAYKPRIAFEQNFLRKAGEHLELNFIEEHLVHLPVEPNIERTEQMLYSRLLAYYVQRGYEIRLNAKQFYNLLKENFKLIDGYWLLDNQIDKYEEWKKDSGLKSIEEISKNQLTLFVSDEKSALIWLFNHLETPRNYSDILTAYNQVITNIDDEIPELKELLDTNFMFENGLYRRPLTEKEKLDRKEKNERALYKTYDKILLQAKSSQKKIKTIRKEAIKLGFTKAYQEKHYDEILTVAKKLDKKIIEESSEINDYIEIAMIKTGDFNKQ